MNSFQLPRNNLTRLLLLIGIGLTLITLYAQYRGPDCDSGTTDSFSPDLREDQIAFLDKNFPEDFDSRSQSDETLLGILRFTDPFKEAATSTTETERKLFVDVGANRGRFVFDVLTHWGNQRMRDTELRFRSLDIDVRKQQQPYNDPIVHAFDISDARIDALKKISSSLPTGALVVHRAAVGDTVGSVQMSESDEGPTLGVGKPLGHIDGTTLDAFFKESKISKAALVKIDVEGFEPAVIKGAMASIRQGIIRQLMFVYGHLWKKEYTGRSADFSLHALAEELFDEDVECYLVAKHRLIKISGVYWDERFELYNRFKYVSVNVWCVHHDAARRSRVLDIYNAPYEIDDYFD